MADLIRDRPVWDDAAVWLAGRDAHGKPFYIASTDWDPLFAEERKRAEERKKLKPKAKER